MFQASEWFQGGGLATKDGIVERLVRPPYTPTGECPCDGVPQAASKMLSECFEPPALIYLPTWIFSNSQNDRKVIHYHFSWICSIFLGLPILSTDVVRWQEVTKDQWREEKTIARTRTTLVRRAARLEGAEKVGGRETQCTKKNTGTIGVVVVFAFRNM